MNEAAIKERPILFSAAMVRAILDGRKTQTRRIADISDPFDYPQFNAKVVNFRKKTYWFDCQKSHPNHIVNACPYGIFGNRLWVRETWMPDAPQDGTWPDVEFYGCKNSPLSWIPDRYRKPEHVLFRSTWDGHELVGWKPSIHMPRWASRINLEITGVRVERLQDISEADAIAEGITADFLEHIYGPAGYRDLWESINGKGSWDKNPWVWVIEFKRIDESVSSC
jgi:hypothetical protein